MLKIFLYPLCFTAFILSVCDLPATPSAVNPPAIVKALDARHVVLTIKLRNSEPYSGFAVRATAIFRNHSKRGFSLTSKPVRAFFNAIKVYNIETGRLAFPTRLMAATPKVWSFNSMAKILIPPGHAQAFWKGVNFAKYYDMTMPGRYRLQIGAGKIASNSVIATIKPLPALPSQVTLIVRGLRRKEGWPVGRRLRIRLRQTRQRHGPSVGVIAFLAGARSRARLTGNPLVDYSAVSVEGPSGVHGDRLATEPQPHWVPIPNRSPVPLTLYGHWLATHPLKDLKWKTYTLKPGVVYKYATPINLSCRFDMSVPGVYRVRVLLAHTHIWSPWAKITVP